MCPGSMLSSLIYMEVLPFSKKKCNYFSFFSFFLFNKTTSLTIPWRQLAALRTSSENSTIYSRFLIGTFKRIFSREFL